MYLHTNDGTLLNPENISTIMHGDLIFITQKLLDIEPSFGLDKRSVQLSTYSSSNFKG